MKKHLSFYSFLMCFGLFTGFFFKTRAQDSTKQEIAAIDQENRLLELDSLFNTYTFEKTSKFDSISEIFVHYALELDSSSLALKNMTTYIAYLNDIQFDYVAGLKTYNKYLDLVNINKNKTLISKYHLNGAESQFFTGNRFQAIDTYNLAERFAIMANDTSLIGLCNLYMGFAYKEMIMLAEASSKFQIAKKYFTSIKDVSNIIASGYGLALLYNENGLLEESKIVREEMIDLAVKHDDNINLAILNYDKADAYFKKELFNKGIESLKTALLYENKAESNDFIYSKIIGRFIKEYIAKRNNDYAKFYIDIFRDNQHRFKNNDNFNDITKHIALFDNNLKLAITLGKKDLVSQTKNKNIENVINANLFLAKIHTLLGNSLKQYQFENQYFRLKDSVLNEQKLNLFTFYQTQYETEKKDLVIANQQKDLKIIKNNLDRRSQISNSIIFIIIITFIFTILLRSRQNQKKEKELTRIFANRLLNIQENERKILASELHDSVGQKLAIITKTLKKSNFEDALVYTKGVIEEIRSISKGLYPPQLDAIGITKSLRYLMKDLDKNSEMLCDYEFQNIDNLFSKDQELHIYRIVQEILSNLIKHSNAKACSFKLSKTKYNVSITLEDNGKGFDYNVALKTNKSLGMRTITERSRILNADLKFKELKPNGIFIMINIPIQTS